MKIEELKIGQTVFVKGIVTDIEKDEILDLEIHTSENNFCVNSSDVYVSIDQPKPEIPQLVAEWIEKYKEKRCRLYHALEHVFDDVELGLYIKQQEGDYTEIIARAWLYGYTVEKEKLYRVKLNDHLYFKEFIDSMFPVFVIDDMPGDLDEAFIGKKELALKHAREFGGRLEEVEKVTE